MPLVLCACYIAPDVFNAMYDNTIKPNIAKPMLSDVVIVCRLCLSVCLLDTVILKHPRMVSTTNCIYLQLISTA